MLLSQKIYPMRSLLVVLSICVLAASCSQNNVFTNDNLKKHFDKHNVNGTFAIYDNGKDAFTVYNLSMYRDSQFLPASTFKIPNSLIALNTGVIDNENTVIKWDGQIRFFPNGDSAKDWNRDLTLAEAFKYSSFSHYQQVARMIGKERMQEALDTLGYGNKKIDTIDRFWVNNTLKISADEQMGFVKYLYFEKLPFNKRSQTIVKKIMLQESTTNYKLSYKTGWGFKENGESIGWMVGWIEENEHPYFFTLCVNGPHETDMFKIRTIILKDILTELGFMQGKK